MPPATITSAAWSGRTLSVLISASAASGTASGNDYVGGLVGDNGGDISHCTAGGDVTGREHVDPLVGRNYGSPIISSEGTGTVNRRN